MMRTLTSTLLAAQKEDAAIPCVKVEAVNRVAGAVRLDWERLYSGEEADYYSALAVPGDGSLVRARLTPPADAGKLYWQRVTAPGPGSDFSQWTYTNQYNAVAVAAASLGAEVSIFWVKTNREIRRIKSTNYGLSWGSPELIDYTPTTSVYGLAAAYKPGGDLAIFFADQATLYIKKRVSGQWQPKSAWDKTTGNLSGVACLHDGDWTLLAAGQDGGGNYRLWSLVYGDGGDVPAGEWSDLKELALAPSGGSFEYRQPFLDKTDVYRCSFIEKYTGTEAYSRPFFSHAVAGSGFSDGLWREPVPFDASLEYGLAMAHDADYVWLSSPAGVWRAGRTERRLDLTADVIGARQESGGASGSLLVELRNDDGRYNAPGQGDLAALDIGCRLDISPGYGTPAGNEYSQGHAFCIESFEHTSSGGRAGLLVQARDAWAALGGWQARQQFRWNRTSDDYSVRDIIAVVLARVGLWLEVVSASDAVTGFYPDFTISPGHDGREVIGKLLSFVPDVIFIEGDTAYLVNPQADDDSVYSYGGEHRIWEGHYKTGTLEASRVQVEGDAGGGLILAESLAWDEIERRGDRFRRIEDRNIGTVAEAQQRGESVLRQMEIQAAGGTILVPVNCGQQLYDVIDVTDERAGLAAVRKRVLGLVLVYNPRRGEYRQQVRLGAP
jgi:hypothetical protein